MSHVWRARYRSLACVWAHTCIEGAVMNGKQSGGQAISERLAHTKSNK